MPRTRRPAFSTTSIWISSALRNRPTGAPSTIWRAGYSIPRVEGDSHARRRTIQAGDLGERIIHARGDRDDQTEGLGSAERAARRDECNARHHPLHDFCEREPSAAFAWHR